MRIEVKDTRIKLPSHQLIQEYDIHLKCFRELLSDHTAMILSN